MDKIDQKALGELRQGRGDIENHIIDEFAAGHISRREFIRRGTVIGMSVPLIGAIVSACGSSSTTPTTKAPGGSSGATIKAGIVVPTGKINPITVSDQGGLDMLAQTGEYLCLSDQHLNLRAVLATSWKANSTGDVWTFTLRNGVKFHNGQPLTADDVVYTYKLQTEPTGKSNALSAFSGVLTSAGVKKIDAMTVQFTLEAPNGNFPYLCSSDNYNMIILPNGYDPASWESTFIGTGPFVMKSYTSKVGATFSRNEDYWGTKALPAETVFTFYTDQPPQITALQSGAIDVIGQFSVSGGEALLASGAYNVIKLRSSAHRELSMRCDMAPFTDPRVRRAVALSLNRPNTITALFKGLADVGNDSPFAPVFPSTNTSVAQRTQNLTEAKALLAAVGHGSGFSTELTTENFLEIPQFAAIVKQFAAGIGVDIGLKVESSSQYYGDAVFGKSDWLDAIMSLVDYGHRAVPNVFLTAPLQSTGTWNAAHFKNSQYDTLSKQYVAAVDLSTQRTLAGQIETLLLNETPIIYAYFYNYLTATANSVSGVYPTAIGHLFLYAASKT